MFQVIVIWWMIRIFFVESGSEENWWTSISRCCWLMMCCSSLVLCSDFDFSMVTCARENSSGFMLTVQLQSVQSVNTLGTLFPFSQTGFFVNTGTLLPSVDFLFVTNMRRFSSQPSTAFCESGLLSLAAAFRVSTLSRSGNEWYNFEASGSELSRTAAPSVKPRWWLLRDLLRQISLSESGCGLQGSYRKDQKTRLKLWLFFKKNLVSKEAIEERQRNSGEHEDWIGKPQPPGDFPLV